MKKGLRIIEAMLSVDHVAEEATAWSGPATRIDDAGVAASLRMLADEHLLAVANETVERAVAKGDESEWRVSSLAHEAVAARFADNEPAMADTGRVAAVMTALEARQPERAESLALRFRGDTDCPLTRALLLELRRQARFEILVHGRRAL